jgi:hypothetical protein
LVLGQDTTEDELNPEDMEGENAEDYSVGVRGIASVTKGHHKMIFSVVFTNDVWIERVRRPSQITSSSPQGTAA